MDKWTSQGHQGNGDAANGGLPVVETSPFELGLDEPLKIRFFSNRPRFVELIHGMIIEFKLQGKIECVTVHVEARGHAEIWREPGDDWNSKRINLDMYRDEKKYLCENLLRHEFGHEADRRNSDMDFDPTIYERWKADFWALNLAMNISLDARLAEGGMGEHFRRENFRDEIRKQFRRANIHEEITQHHELLFKEAWANPARTWPEIEALSTTIRALINR